MVRGWDAATFGDTMTDYDTLDWAIATDQNEAVDFLSGFVRGGRALELGVGTGRIAIPLAEKDVATVGIEGSRAMAAQLTAKLRDGDTDVEVVVGDFADVSAPGPFDLVYCVFNTFYLLLSQGEQVRCFQNTAAALAPGGVFVVQATAPQTYLLTDRQSARTLHVSVDRTVIMTSVHDSATQRVDSQQVVLTAAGNQLYPMAYRYVWPTEMDLMAHIAGLKLLQRNGGWLGERFTGTGKHVSVYQKPAS